MIEIKEKRIIYYGFGKNKFGELGLGDSEIKKNPQKINWFKNNKIKIKKIYLGFYYYHYGSFDEEENYSFSLFLSSKGELFKIGKSYFNCENEENKNNNDNNEKEKEKIFLIPNKIKFPEKILKLSLGYNFLFIITQNKKVYSIGNNSFGQLGFGNQNNSFFKE